jgi:hypothetical protein
MAIEDPRFGVRVRAAVITLVVAAVTFPMTFVIWPPLVPSNAPIAAQVLGYGLIVAECLAMGGGVAFIALTLRPLRRLRVLPPLLVAAYVGIAFDLLNWWTHDHLHAVAFTLDFSSLVWMSIAIDYVFHAGMMVFGVVLALFFTKILTAGPAAESASAPAAVTTEAPKEVMVG